VTTRTRGIEARRARRGRRLALLAVTAAAAVAFQPPPVAASRIDGVAVDAQATERILAQHELRSRKGETLTLESLRGEVVVVNFWASWCKPCRRELPGLDALHAELSRKGGRVVAVSIDIDGRNVDRFVKAHDLGLPVYHDGPDGLARKLDLGHVPFTVVIDRAGSVAFSTSDSDAKALAELTAVTRRLADAKPYLSRIQEGEAR
jgi:thiol-disulfide isomerase/thioredoxin